MNSEELEISLRTEFESYLRGIFAEMRQEVSQFQEKLDAELERHKSELESVFTSVLTRVGKTPEFNAGFKDSIIEHLRLAKDEGARITATAIAEAEAMEKESAFSAAATAPPRAAATGFKEIHEAVNDISCRQSQSEILKSLVQYAGQFAARGAFFIIKSDHLVGWRTFGSENASTDEKVREVFLPLSADSLLSEAVNSLETVRNSAGDRRDDVEVFGKLDFGSAQQPVAIPLVARGRGVAVLYADRGADGATVNVEALETLVRVAGLTVEVLASAKSAVKLPKSPQVSTDEYAIPAADTEAAFKPQSEEQFSEVEPAESLSTGANDYGFSTESAPERLHEAATEQVTEQPFYVREPSIAPSVQEDAPPQELPETVAADSYAVAENYAAEVYEVQAPSVTAEAIVQSAEEKSFAFAEPDRFQPIEPPKYPIETPEYAAPNQYSATQTESLKYDGEYSDQIAAAPSEESVYQPTLETAYQPALETTAALADSANGYQPEIVTAKSNGFELTPPAELYQTPEPAPEQISNQAAPHIEKPAEPAFEPVLSQPAAPIAPKTRFSERNVDLPIEVSEDERRLHNDARRFARLLVSEIKLYNEQKVKEGRAAGDLYDRLREAIDRSREMYDKRVQPPVAAKFDYFDYEVVNTLAEGDAGRLGVGYPGATA